MTLAAWLVGFLIVMALLTVFGDQLGSLPVALRALLISGVMVVLMVNVVMPALTVVVFRRIGLPRSPRRGSSAAPGEDSAR
jgi:antibiotic biosynthesis monooxygenase (ABM) superfamily enzyme